jgi:predicted secreted Zn-dependent protease
MFYVARLTDGSCAIVMAADDSSARHSAAKFVRNAEAEVATVRALDHFAAQFFPTEDGGLEITNWDAATLESILANEYPCLKEACRSANAEPLLPARDTTQPALRQLQAAFERNSQIIRQGLQQELERSKPAVPNKSKAAQR